ncbi:Release factor glutamine methyltransferase [Buchnera aphidicola (Eriosoma lanigerum)]|uniref:peptide chain release factor N(5)-glutamine methyltransferase n=1 Tax=Buchnera aphidicola TaxID=9 RepID=UPI00346480F5
MNILNWFKLVSKRLSHINNSRYDLEILLSFVIKKSKSWIIGFNDYQLSENEVVQLEKLIIRRSLGEPIAYLLGEQEFWSLPFKVSKEVLIPRPETEILVELCLYKLQTINVANILDLGTGSGVIALSIASIKKECHITGIDCMQSAITISKYNAKILQISNVHFICSDWFSSINSKLFHVIVSNPPYISINEYSIIRNNLKYEPIKSLVSHSCGLGDIMYIIQNAKNYLYSHGWLLIEHGWNQKYRVQNLFKYNDFINIKTYQDYSGHDRVTIGQKK